MHDLLAESGLGQFYDLNRHPGVRIRQQARREQWAYLDDPALQQRLLDFTDGKVSRVTFQIPAIHCVACVWLLENLFRLHPGVGRSQVNFPRREAAITFAPEKIRLSELVGLLASIGYEPVLTLGELEKRKGDPARKRQWLQVGIAGFAFGNIMLLSLPVYLGLDSFSGPLFRVIFGYLSLALAAPVVFYSASDYWRSARLSLRQRMLTLDVPIALGLAALYAQSAYEIVLGRGPGLPGLAGGPGVLPALRAGVPAEDARPDGVRPRLQVLLPAVGDAQDGGRRGEHSHLEPAGGGPAAAAQRRADSRRCAAGERAGVH